MTRLDRVDQGLLEAASAAGTGFSIAGVAAALGAPPAEVEGRCAELVRCGHFLTAREPVSPPDGDMTAHFGFRHALYQEVLYARMSATRRVQLHRTIGVQLERDHGDRAGEIAAELATHFDLGGDAARAVRYLQHAGRHALANSAHHEAIRHFTRALDLLPMLAENRARTEREVALLLGLGPAWMAARGYAASEVGETYSRALVDAGNSGKPPAVPGARRACGTIISSGPSSTPPELSDEFLTRAEKAEIPVLMLRALAELGQTLLHQGEIGRRSEPSIRAEVCCHASGSSPGILESWPMRHGRRGTWGSDGACAAEALAVPAAGSGNPTSCVRPRVHGISPDVSRGTSPGRERRSAEEEIVPVRRARLSPTGARGDTCSRGWAAWRVRGGDGGRRGSRRASRSTGHGRMVAASPTS